MSEESADSKSGKHSRGEISPEGAPASVSVRTEKVGLVPCGRNRGELDDLLEKWNAMPPGDEKDGFFKLYFFNTSAPLHLTKKFTSDQSILDELKDGQNRCKSCGCTIPEHKPAPPAAVIEELDIVEWAPKINVNRLRWTLANRRPFLDRDAVVKMAMEYISNTTSDPPILAPDDQDRVALLGTSGLPGMGKTTLLHRLAHKCNSIDGGKRYLAVYITFNGGPTNNFVGAYERYLDHRTPKPVEACDAFAYALLWEFRKSDVKAPRVTLEVTFKDVLTVLRKAADVTSETSIVFLIDELPALEENRARALQKSLNKFSDPGQEGGQLARKKENVVFVVSHLLESWIKDTSPQTGSGRPVTLLALQPLSYESWWKFDEGFAAAARNFPAFHQLLLSACGHPRSLAVLSECVSSFTNAALNPQVDPLNDLKWEIKPDVNRGPQFLKEWCDVINHSNPDFVGKWLASYVVRLPVNLGHGEMELEFFALGVMLQCWVARTVDHPKRDLLKNMFSADRRLGSGSESAMDRLMANFEGLWGLVSHGETLSDYYHKGSITSDLGEVRARRMGIGSDTFSPLKSVPQFTDDDGTAISESVIDLLVDGKVVISEDGAMSGIEYMVPFEATAKGEFKDFREREDSNGEKYHELKSVKEGDLLVALVQCKFSPEFVKWSDIKEKIKPVVEELERTHTEMYPKRCIHLFPVVYTVSDQDEISMKTSIGSVAYTAESLFQFTSLFGILRMHTLKLGDKLKGKYPFLKPLPTPESSAEVPTETSVESKRKGT